MRVWKIFISAILIASTIGVVTLRRGIFRPFLSQDADLTIPKGATTNQIRSMLEKLGPVNRTLYVFLVASNRWEGRLKAGTYLFPAKATLLEVMDMVARGKVVQAKITVPEGSTIKTIASFLEEAEICSGADFVTTATDKTVTASFGFQAESMEGYLFPDTYYFSPGIRPMEVVTAMTKRFWEVWAQSAFEYPLPTGLTFHQTVTLASLVEKETADDSERPLVAAVFLNRLRKGKRLESDPTVIYALPNFDGNIHKKDLSYDSPYNTYRYRGLPPGPIASPGRPSLEAAISPAEVDYLYFVARPDGKHHFSRTLEEHNRAVRKYQLKIR